MRYKKFSSVLAFSLFGAMLVSAVGNGVSQAGSINAAGPLTIRSLPDSEDEDIPLCFDSVSGKVGQCAGVLPGNMVYVEQQGGGDFTDVLDALNAITDASESNPYVIFIGPGVYDLGSSQLVMKPHVYIKGAGMDATILVTHRLDTSASSWMAGSFVLGATDGALMDLTVHNECGNENGICGAIYNHVNKSPKLIRIRAKATGGTNTGAVQNDNSSSPTIIDSILVSQAWSGASVGLYSYFSCHPTVKNSVVQATGGSLNVGVWTKSNSSTVIEHSVIEASTVTVRNTWSGAFSNIFASRLSGGAVDQESSILPKCAGVTDENFDFYASTCP